MDFKTLTLCVFLNSSQLFTIFCKDFVNYRLLSVPGEKFDSQLLSIFKLILFFYAHLAAMSLMSREIRVQFKEVHQTNWTV